MANNLRYLLEHFCLDGQKIDISSQLDEENANNIEKINTQTIPSINTRIDDIKNTDIPNINSRIDTIKNTDIPSINQKINTINNTTIPSVQENVSAVNEKANRINESVAKNTRDISNLSDNVTMQGNSINSINTEKIPKIENNINGINDSLSTLHDETSSNTTNIGNLTTNVNELTTKVNTNTDSINGLTTKVDTNTDSINTINNTSIPHLQSEIDSLSGGGSGSVGELREKVEKNTTDISKLSGKVDTNTTAISTINDTSIPNLQSEIDNLKGSGTGSIGELRTKVEKNTSDISELNGKVESNTSDITELSGKVDTNTSAISSINGTSIPNLQSEIDNLKGSGTGSIGELRTKVEKNTSDISELNGKVESNTSDITELSGKVDTNTSAISSINGTSIPNLQSEIDNLKTSNTWRLINGEETTIEDIILTAKEYTNDIINYLTLTFNFKDIESIKLNYGYLFLLETITPPILSDVRFDNIVTFNHNQVGTITLNVSYNKTGIILTLSNKTNITSVFNNVTANLFYF